MPKKGMKYNTIKIIGKLHNNFKKLFIIQIIPFFYLKNSKSYSKEAVSLIGSSDFV